MDYFRLSAGQDTIERLSALGLAHLGDGVYEPPPWAVGTGPQSSRR